MSDFMRERRDRIAAALPLEDGLLVIGAGRPVPLPENSDQTYPFRAHAEFVYLADANVAGAVITYDPRDRRAGGNGWTLFVPTVTEAERVWEGRTQTPGTPLAQLERWLAERSGRPAAMLGAAGPGVQPDAALTERSRAALTHARRPKDAHELALLRRAVQATAEGYARLRETLRAGVSERQLQIELEAGFFRGGAQCPGYGTIVGSGPNSAVLHVEPSDRPVRPGEFVLVDAGAEVSRYTADITRTYVVGPASGFQRDWYAIVQRAERSAIARCRAGTEWKHIHLATAVEMVEGLVDLGVMKGNPTALVERDAHTLFFPHGLGHMVGLGVRDGSGLAPGRSKDPRPSLATLRMDLPLAAGYVVTVEPGLYMIPALLTDPARRGRYRDCVDWNLVDAHLALGGVRIEDNVLVTEGAPEVLTAAVPIEPLAA